MSREYTDGDKVAAAIHEAFVSENITIANLEPANIIEAVNQGMQDVAIALTRISHGDTSGPTGLEGASMKIHDGLALIAGAISELAEAIRGR